MSLGTGTSGQEAVVAETQFLKSATLGLKTHTHTSHDASRTDGSGEEVVAGTPPITSRWELWAWYAYAFGNNSAGPLSYAPLIFQSVLNQAGFNGHDPTQDCSDTTAPCQVHFGGKATNIATVVLTCNGIVFALQGVLLILFGSMGDYGSVKRYVLIACTLVCWGAQFGFLALKGPSQYEAAIGVYIISYLSYNLCVAFWYPSFPQLAANTPEALESKKAFEAGQISEEEYSTEKMLMRNKLSNFAFGGLSVGYTLTLLIALGAAYGLGANDSSAANLQAAVIIVAISTAVWIISGTPWFFLEKSRSVPLPKGENYITVGIKTYWQAFRHFRKLSNLWLYFLGYFALSDGYATTNQLFGICQNNITVYSTTMSTAIYIVQGAANAFGILAFWLIQKHFRVQTKKILIANMAFLLLMPLWGCIGIGTKEFGFHKAWEVWAFSVVDCAAVAPFYAFSATMLSDLCPKGREVTFFAIYALVGKSTAWIGPIISGQIIDHSKSGATQMGFTFSLALTVVGFVLICCVNVKEGQEEAAEWVLNDPTLQAVRGNN